MKEETQRMEYTTEPVLYLAFELGNAKWKLGFSIGLAQKPRRRRGYPALSGLKRNSAPATNLRRRVPLIRQRVLRAVHASVPRTA